jgi:hypothetical protein
MELQENSQTSLKESSGMAEIVLEAKRDSQMVYLWGC